MHSSFIITGTGSLANIVEKNCPRNNFLGQFFFIQIEGMAGGAFQSSFHAYPAPVSTFPGSWRIVPTASSWDP
jgi:hypothetical protein